VLIDEGADAVFERAERYLDVGHTKLRSLWDDWVAVKGKSLPPSAQSRPPPERMMATGGDNLEQLKDKLTAWLKDNAAAHGLLVGVTRCTKLCKDWGHYPPLFTPPYHPELQPIERLWRDVKQYVSREFTGTRTVTVLREHVIAGFRKYGSAASCAGRIRKAVEEEDLYVREGVYAEVIDLTLLDDDSDDELELAEDELGVFDDSDDEANDVYDD